MLKKSILGLFQLEKQKVRFLLFSIFQMLNAFAKWQHVPVLPSRVLFQHPASPSRAQNPSSDSGRGAVDYRRHALVTTRCGALIRGAGGGFTRRLVADRGGPEMGSI